MTYSDIRTLPVVLKDSKPVLDSPHMYLHCWSCAVQPLCCPLVPVSPLLTVEGACSPLCAKLYRGRTAMAQT